MSGKTETDPEKPLDPKGRPRRQPGKVRMHMAHTRFKQSGPEIGRLIKAEKIGFSSPGRNFTARRPGQPAFAQRRVHLPH